MTHSGVVCAGSPAHDGTSAQTQRDTPTNVHACIHTYTHADTPCSPVVRGESGAGGADRWRRCSEGIQKRTNDRETRDSLSEY